MALKSAAMVAAAAGLMLAAPAAAGATVRIPDGQVVQDVRVIGDDVLVEGHARGHTIVVDGNLIVARGGRADNVAVIGGRLRTEPGGAVSGDVFQIGGSWPQPDGWPLGVILALLVLVRLAAVWAVVAAAALFAPREAVQRLGDAARARPLRTLSVGALAGLGASVGSVLLALSLVGLPIAAALWGLLLLAIVAGLSLMFAWEGGSARGRRITLAFLAIPVIGDGLALLAGAVGLGALLRYAGEGRATVAAGSASHR